MCCMLRQMEICTCCRYWSRLFWNITYQRLQLVQEALGIIFWNCRNSSPFSSTDLLCRDRISSSKNCHLFYTFISECSWSADCYDPSFTVHNSTWCQIRINFRWLIQGTNRGHVSFRRRDIYQLISRGANRRSIEFWHGQLVHSG